MFYLGCLFTSVVIAIQAFGHHALISILSSQNMAIFDTATRYLTWGSLWIMIFAIAKKHLVISKLGVTFIFVGLGLFCASLLVYLVLPIRGLMILTPVGGAFMILGFGICAFSGWFSSQKNKK